MTEWLSVPEFAARLSERDSHVRELLKERHIVGARRGENNALSIPADFIIEVDGEATIIPTLRGTITVLTDGGFDDNSIVEWLIEDNDELGESPIQALRSGKRAPVRRVAQSLL